MRCAFIFLSYAFLTVSPALARPIYFHAGADSSGGGKSVVCRDTDGHLKSIELLDLFEARAMYGLAPQAMGNTLEEVLATAREKLRHSATAIEANVLRPMDNIHHNLRVLPEGTRLEPIDDASPIVIPAGCALEQTAAFVDDSLVVVDREHWQVMDARNQGALIAHEAVYRLTRIAKATNSRRARKIVGHLFSLFEFEHVGDTAQPQSAICSARIGADMEMLFWVYPDSEGAPVFDFLFARGQLLFSRTTARVASQPGLSWPLGKDLQPGHGGVLEFSSRFEVLTGIMIYRPLESKDTGPFQSLYLEDGEKRYPVDCSPIASPR